MEIGSGMIAPKVPARLKDLSGSGGGTTCPEPTAANGAAWIGEVNLVIGAGASYLSGTQLGRLTTYSWVNGPLFGFDVSLVSTFYGRSRVYEIQEEDCLGASCPQEAGFFALAP